MKYSYEDIDQRIIKTKVALTDAIVNIMKTNMSVKVLDICKQADITPMTYYHHFGNKNQLLAFAIRKQFENKMPIPLKLKPVNIRQLIAYLIRIFSDYAYENKQLLIASYEKLLEKGYENSYVQTLINTIKDWIFGEINYLFPTYELITKNIICNFLTYGLICTIITRIIENKNCKFLYIWDSIKILLN